MKSRMQTRRAYQLLRKTCCRSMDQQIWQQKILQVRHQTTKTFLLSSTFQLSRAMSPNLHTVAKQLQLANVRNLKHKKNNTRNRKRRTCSLQKDTWLPLPLNTCLPGMSRQQHRATEKQNAHFAAITRHHAAHANSNNDLPFLCTSQREVIFETRSCLWCWP